MSHHSRFSLTATLSLAHHDGCCPVSGRHFISCTSTQLYTGYLLLMELPQVLSRGAACLRHVLWQSRLWAGIYSSASADYSKLQKRSDLHSSHFLLSRDCHSKWDSLRANIYTTFQLVAVKNLFSITLMARFNTYVTACIPSTVVTCTTL